MKDSNIKHGLFVVTCMNIGDDIQSLAARRFLPKVDHYIDRDRLNLVRDLKFNKDEKLKVIMNGWYLGGYQHWPPKNQALDPLLTSIHINPLQDNGAARDQFVSEESLSFLKQYSPVGARDMSTLKLLQDNGVDAYFSACMTLTLNPEKSVKKKDFILAVNVSDGVYESIKQKTKRPVIRMDVERTQDTTIEENLALAQYYLYMYQSAHCVVSTRLHATLPTVAIGGKVLFIVERNGDNADFNDRFNGLYDLVHHMSANDFIQDTKSKKYSIDKPPENPEHYREYRKNLEQICTKYTGYDSKQSYMNGQSIEDIVTSPEFFSGITKIAEESWDSFKYKHRWSIPPILYDELNGSDRRKAIIDELNQRINLEENPGIITATKRLARAILYKLTVLKR